MACLAAVDRGPYQPRAAEMGVLHTVVREHLETFLREAADRSEGAGVPHFIAACSPSEAFLEERPASWRRR